MTNPQAQSGAFPYPFTAIVGQQPMKMALSLVAVQPQIGGVLILGQRGTAKTTAVRSLPGVMPEGVRVIELPLNATEDRVVGALHVETLMKTGKREFVPGVMAEADGNILYVDEINLLEDHIVDILLDAAATGVCRVEREGISQTYPAHFVLVGTMNPEEGTLRPQLLDRFGLSVRVEGSLTSSERLELVRRHMAFETDPAAFCAQYAEAEHAHAQRIALAIQRYPEVELPGDMAEFAVGVCSEIASDGYRADIAIMRTARAAAALEGHTRVTSDDVLLAARFVLPHRMKRQPFEEMALDEKTLSSVANTLQKQMAAKQATAISVEDEKNEGDSAKKA